MTAATARWSPGALPGQSGLALVQIIPGRRAEQLIGTARVIMGLCLLLAVVGQSETPAFNRPFAVALLVAYSTGSALLLIALAILKHRVLHLRAAIHAVDVFVMAALLWLTGGAMSGYFSTLFFPIVSGALRWRQTGALRTGATLLLIFMALSVASSMRGELNVNTWLVRSAALVATVLILGQMRNLENRYATQIEALGGWPGFSLAELPELAEGILQRSTAIFGAGSGLLLVDEPEEPWLHVFLWKNGAMSQRKRPYAYHDGLIVPRDLENAPLLLEPGAEASVTLHGERGSAARVAIPQWMVDELQGDAILSVPVRSEGVEAHLFLVDAPNATSDDLAVAQLLGRHVSSILEHSRLTDQLKMMSANDERVRLSRNLHDGVLQTLSGIALNLATARQQFAIDPAGATERLIALEQLLLDEQRDLRFFTDELRLSSPIPADAVSFADTLEGLLHRLETIWGVTVTWSRNEAANVPPILSPQVYQLVHEAVVNASRHGRATGVSIRFFTNRQQLMMTVADNGSGFNFHGTFSLEQLKSEKRGPRSLRERVEALGGDISVESSPAGARIVILLPMAEDREWA
jgi:signal transduction histidine kinase